MLEVHVDVRTNHVDWTSSSVEWKHGQVDTVSANQH